MGATERQLGPKAHSKFRKGSLQFTRGRERELNFSVPLGMRSSRLRKNTRFCLHVLDGVTNPRANRLEKQSWRWVVNLLGTTKGGRIRSVIQGSVDLSLSAHRFRQLGNHIAKSVAIG